MRLSTWKTWVASHPSWDQLDEQICVSWIQGPTATQVVAAFNGVSEDLNSQLNASVMDVATDQFAMEPVGPSMLLRQHEDWTIVLEVITARGVNADRLAGLTTLGQAFAVSWDVNWNSSAVYAKGGQIVHRFEPYAVEDDDLYQPDEFTTPEEIRDYTNVIAWSESVGVVEAIWKEDFKTASLSIGEKLCGVPVAEEWVNSAWTRVRFQH